MRIKSRNLVKSNSNNRREFGRIFKENRFKKQPQKKILMEKFKDDLRKTLYKISQISRNEREKIIQAFELIQILEA